MQKVFEETHRITIRGTVLLYVVQCYYTWYSVTIHGTVLLYVVQCYYTWYSVTIRGTVLLYVVQCYYIQIKKKHNPNTDNNIHI